MSGGGEKEHENPLINGGTTSPSLKSQHTIGKLGETLGSPEKEFIKLISEVINLKHSTYLDNGGNKVRIFYPNDGGTKSITIFIKGDRKLELWLSDNGDSFLYVSKGNVDKHNPDTNGDDKDLVFSVLTDIKKCIDDCKNYRDKKEEEPKSPLIVKFMKLHDKLLNDEISYPTIIARSNDRLGDDVIVLEIGDYTVFFRCDLINGKLSIDGYRDNQELPEGESEKLLSIVENLINGDRSVEVADLPSGLKDHLISESRKTTYEDDNDMEGFP